jgi:hypothetical protein
MPKSGMLATSTSTWTRPAQPSSKPCGAMGTGPLWTRDQSPQSPGLGARQCRTHRTLGGQLHRPTVGPHLTRAVTGLAPTGVTWAAWLGSPIKNHSGALGAVTLPG